MDCVNHSGVSATAFCQNCGKALCAGCVRTAPGGQVLCEPCFATWQNYQQPFVAHPAGGPNPAAAAVLGIIPGVGAMYNGQFFKGLIHVVIFAVLVSMSHISGIFGIFIPAWIIYQSFEAFHTAKALRDGLPVPDPLGLNNVGDWINLGRHPQYPGQPPRAARGDSRNRSGCGLNARLDSGQSRRAHRDLVHRRRSTSVQQRLAAALHRWQLPASVSGAVSGAALQPGSAWPA